MSAVDFWFYLISRMEWINSSTYPQFFRLDLLEGYLDMAFVLPLIIFIFIYISALIVHIYRFWHSIKDAYDRDVWEGARHAVCTMWYTVGYIWHGYDVSGFENIPETGPALLVYYHGAIPLDIYYFQSLCLLRKGRLVHAVGDRFMFRIPGWGLLMQVYKISPGTIQTCTQTLKEGNLLSIAPGGVLEAQFGDENYNLVWGKRVGFAKVALQAKAPIIPVFTENMRESFRTAGIFRAIGRRIYERIHFPVIPIYGGFPVKLRTHVGKPIPYDEAMTPEELANKTSAAIQELIKQHQRLPGSIFWALIDRIVKKRCKTDDSDESCYIPRRKRRRLEMSSRRSLRISARQRLSNTNVIGSSYLTRRTMRAIKEEQEMATNNDDCIFDDGQDTEDDNDDDNDDDDDDEDETVMDDSSPPNSGIRRSTRQRKSRYETLDQSWIISSKLQEFTNMKTNDKIDGDSRSNEQFDDMYSRVKNIKRQSDPEEKKRSETEESIAGAESDDETSIVMGRERCRGGGSRWNSKSSSDEMPHMKYDLRRKKPVINRFQVVQESSRPKKVSTKNVFHISPPHRRTKFNGFKSPAHKSPTGQRRHATHNSSGSSSSTSSSSDDDRRFERRKAKSMARARNRCLPTNFNAIENKLTDRLKAGGRMADIDPMNIDRTVNFESIGGLTKHVERLKEMILFPMLYPEVFEKFKITPPRGVLFYGPPGTGKTLVARALANECSLGGDRTVAFFMRKGADCLSKWVGESERQLRLLFDQAFVMRPSIIFFDEIDGLAPVRSSRQDQIHSSIVSTLLALMDGLDNRGEVVVIGATNRIDAIDPALRRPGRFDREFHFPLPSLEDRENILKIHTKEWSPKFSPDFVTQIALKTAGYCGADLKALCAEVALSALKRRYPQIYNSRQRLQLDFSSIKVEAKDFLKAIDNLVPSGQRAQISPGHPLTATIQPLMQKMHDEVLAALKKIFPHKTAKTANDKNYLSDTEKMDIYEGTEVVDGKIVMPKSTFNAATSHRPRLLIAGAPDQGQTTHLAPAILHSLECFPVHRLDLPTLYAVSAKTPEESCAQVFAEAYRTRPSILYFPHLDQWWGTLSDTTRATFLTLLQDVDPGAPVLVLATSDCPCQDLPEQMANLFSIKHNEVFSMVNPSTEQRYEFFSDVIIHLAAAAPKLKRKHESTLEELPVAPPKESRKLSKNELRRLEEQEEATLRELRLFLREILYKLARDRRFTSFTKPVDIAEVSDYLDVVKFPMDLESMLTKIDTHLYETVSQFLDDYKIIRHRACALRDAAHAIVDSELDPEFEKICQDIIEARRRRGCPPTKYAPQNYRTVERNSLRLAGGHDETPEVENEAEVESSIKRFSRRVRGLQVEENSSSTDGNDVNAPKSMDSSNGPVSKSTDGNDSGSELVRVKKKSKICIKSDDSGTDEVKKAKTEPSKATTSGGSFVIKRRKSLWFGGGRRIVRRSVEKPVAKVEQPMEVERPVPSLFCDDEDDQLNSDLSKDSGTACAGPADSPLPSEKNGENDELKEVSSGFSSEEGNTLDGKDICERLTAGGCKTKKRGNTWIKSLHDVVDKSITTKPASMSPVAPAPAPTPEVERHVIVDRNRLQWLLDSIVKATHGCSTDVLERFHCALRMCVMRHARQWDKTSLVKELESQLDVFKRQQQVS
uniref:Tat-binding homolog 7 n=1 Tax=Strigamia maritima TaxID=126957 RepID=T1IKQ0_STRMM